MPLRPRHRRLAQLEHAGHLLEPLLDEHRKPASPLLLSRTIGHEVVHAAEQGMGLGCSVLVRQQKVAVLRQQVSTMPGFRVDESRQRQIDGLEHLVGVLDQGGGVREAEYWRTARPPERSKAAMATRKGHRQACDGMSGREFMRAARP